MTAPVPLTALIPTGEGLGGRLAHQWARRLIGPDGRIVRLDLHGGFPESLPGGDGATPRPVLTEDTSDLAAHADPSALPTSPLAGVDPTQPDAETQPGYHELADVWDDDLLHYAPVTDGWPAVAEHRLAVEIARAADRVGAGLVVVAPVEQSPREQNLLRSIAAHSPVPVVLVHPRVVPPAATPQGAGVVLALDGSKKAELALDVAMALARVGRAPIHLARVLSTDVWTRFGLSRRQVLADARHYLARAAALLYDQGFETDAEVLVGEPGDLLATVASKRRSLAVVLAAERPVPGEVAPVETVVRRIQQAAFRPVVVVPCSPPACRSSLPANAACTLVFEPRERREAG